MSRTVPAAPSLVAVSAGTRVAGAIVAFGYLLGVVEGPVIAVVGGLALMTFGRVLLHERSDGVRVGASLAVLAGALGVGALRWETLDLSSMRGAQSVLGASVLVDPDVAAGGSWAAVGAAALALGLWGGARLPGQGAAAVWRWIESAGAALAVTTVFWGPKLVIGSPRFWSDLGLWVLGVGVLVGTAAALGWFLRRAGGWVRWVTLALSGAAVIGATAAVVVAR
ncbi:MAG: hypothetical protein ACRDKB_13295 [Actinomycetota bacterium]